MSNLKNVKKQFLWTSRNTGNKNKSKKLKTTQRMLAFEITITILNDWKWKKKHLKKWKDECKPSVIDAKHVFQWHSIVTLL